MPPAVNEGHRGQAMASDGFYPEGGRAMGAGTSEEIQERIAAALVLAERVCAKCRPARIESGPQSEAQWEEDMREMYPGWGEAE